jgi:hypothetical protein
MKYASFSNGTQGFILHNVALASKWSGRCSAWYDANGKLLDAEQYVGTWTKRTRPVKVGGPMWRELSRLGPVYANRPEAHKEGQMMAARIATRTL